MIAHKHPTAMKNYESIGQHQQGTIASRRLEFLHVIESPNPFRNSERDGSVNRTATVRKLASLPNQSYVTAIDINIIKEYFMPMDPKHRSETEDILSDPVIMEALQCADRQYREGKAVPLEDLMREMGFEEDDL